MSISAHFSVTTAGALVLGGMAAVVLATVIALRSSTRSSDDGAKDARQAASSGRTAPLSAVSLGGAPSEAEVEYLLDTSD